MSKNKKLICIGACLCLLLSFAACKKTPKVPETDNPVTPPVETPVTPPETQEGQEIELTPSTYTDELKNADNTITLAKAHLSFPKTSGETEALMNINSYYDNIMEKQQIYFKEEVLQQAQDNLVFTADNNTQFVEFSLESEYWVACNDGKVLSVVRSYDEFLGGSVTHSTLSSDSFSAETGALLTLSDLFSVPSDLYMKRLLELVKVQAKTRKDLLSDYENLLETSFQPNDFYLCKEDNGSMSLVLVYQPYSIAPGSVGVIDFEIPFKDLADIIKK